MPKLSVIIPVYNVENYLGKCLDSVIYPELEDYEIILVNEPQYSTLPQVSNALAGSGRSRPK